jgi:hypothetical protein
MSPKFLFRGVLAVFIAGSGFAVLSQIPQQPISTTYILSHAICLPSPPAPPVPLPGGCAVQTIPAGTDVEIQLPGGPSVWRESSVSPGLFRLNPPQILDSPGRIEGTNKIYRFRYKFLPVSAGFTETVSFAERPQFLSKPVGQLTFTITRK